MQDTDRIAQSLGTTESGSPLGWRTPQRIWTFGRRLILEDEAIVWRRDLPHDGHRVLPDFTLLVEFVRLAEESIDDEQFLVFARRWGLLGLCSHGLPRTHDQNTIPYSVSFGLWLNGDWNCSSGVESPEPVEWWRYWARQARALVALIASVRMGEAGAIEHWETVWSPGPWVRDELREKTRDVIEEVRLGLHIRVIDEIGVQRDELAHSIETWLRLASVGLKVHWWSEGPRPVLTNVALFDTIGMLILFLGGDSSGFAVCSGCHAPFMPQRRLGPRDRARYCADCRRDHRPQREASRSAYRRNTADPVFRAKEAARRRASRRRRPGD
jgi:hypothetical protein